jgi:hypothetical protein
VKQLRDASALVITLALAGSAVFAQSPPSEAGRVEVSVGAVRIGRVSFGERDAEETTGSGDGRFRLFSSTSELTGVSGFGTCVGLNLIRSLDVELSGTYSTPVLRTRIDADVEASNTPIVTTAPVQQFTIGGALVWYPPAPRLGSRTRLFARGGIGVERHLEDGGKRVVDGRTFEAGGGVKHLFASRSRGWWKGIGVRFDALALIHTSAVTLDNRAHVSPTVGASVYLRF